MYWFLRKVSKSMFITFDTYQIMRFLEEFIHVLTMLYVKSILKKISYALYEKIYQQSSEFPEKIRAILYLFL